MWNDRSCMGITVRIPCKQSTVCGTSILLYPNFWVSSSPWLHTIIGRPYKWDLRYPFWVQILTSMLLYFTTVNLFPGNSIWAAIWQNQQNESAPSKDSDQPGHPPSLIRVFAVRMKKPWVLSYPLSAQQRHWSDLADAQADLSLCWAHTHLVGFVMSRLISLFR